MEIQNTPVTASTKTTAGSGSAVGQTAGKTPGSGDLSFSVILGGQEPSDAQAGSAAPDNQTTSLLGLLQMMQLLLTPMQNQNLINSAGDQQGSQTLPELLVQALTNPSELSDKLLQDSNLQQWLAQAAALIPTLAAANGNPVSTTPALTLTSGIEPTKLSAQQTLLQFADLAKQHPENPIVRHLMAELQKTVEPILTAAASPDSPSDLLSQLQGSADTTTQTVNQLTKHPQKAAAVAEQMGLVSLTVDVTPDSQVQQTKSKLEILAARSGGIAAAVQQLLSDNGAEESGLKDSAQDSTSFQAPAMPLQDLLKTLQQAETSLKQPQATVNAQAFVRDMSDYMVKNMKLSVGDVFKEATLSLRPENLGQVDVKITLHANGQLIAQLSADTIAGKQLLESQLPQLRQALQSQGLQVERLEVSQEAAASSMFQQSRQQGGGQPFERQPQERTLELEAIDGEFANDLRTLADHRKEQGAATGYSFDATA